jgi:hypothetical protein
MDVTDPRRKEALKLLREIHAKMRYATDEEVAEALGEPVVDESEGGGEFAPVAPVSSGTRSGPKS